MVNKNSNQETGKAGENAAMKFLQVAGYKIIERNFWKPWGELDIVALAPDKTLVFVEVKTLEHKLDDSSIQPEENLTRAKLKKLQRAAQLYANSHPKLVDDKRGWRLDLIAINILDEEVRDKNESEKFDIRHYENI